MDVRVIYRACPTCGASFGQPDDPGRKRRFGSDACKQIAYRARRRAREQAVSAPRTTPAASVRSRLAAPATAPGALRPACRDQSPRPLLRLMRRPPRPPHHPPRPGAAHDRARRRYDGLHAKAASTGFPEEADACRAKAEQLRAKYGL